MNSNLRIEESDRWVRVVRDGVTIVNCQRPRLVYGKAKIPLYYFPTADVRVSASDIEDQMDDLVRLGGKAGDLWFEEDEALLCSWPRDPYHRVDPLRSSREVVVKAHGKEIARTVKPIVVHETKISPRYYLPQLDVREGVLVPSAKSTVCQYKGVAHYWNVIVDGSEVVDAAWSYPHPIPSCSVLSGHISFLAEGIVIEVDGKPVSSS